MAKPKKSVDLKDPKTFGQPGAFDTIRGLAEANGWTTGFGVAMTAGFFEPRLPNMVTAAEIEAAKGEIIARGLKERGQKAAEKQEDRGDVRDRMDEETAQNWDLGRWKRKFPIRILFERYPEGNLTGQMLDDLAAELATKKEADAKVVDERPDPDPLVAEIKMPCAAKRHSGANPLELAGMRNKVERGDDGQLRIRTHSGGQDPIVGGDFLKLGGFEGQLPPGVIRVEEAGTVIFGRRYCLDCQTAAKEEFRARRELPATDPNHVEGVLTFYTVEGLRVIARREASGSQARDEESGSSHRPSLGSQFGSRKTWKTGGASRHRGR